jgi:voltage-gated sodium channel
VVATNVFGPKFPEWFGTLFRSMYSLFQIMTLESWSMGIVRPVMQEYPYAWLLFVPFIILATYTVMNLFIGILVSAISEIQSKKPESEQGSGAVKEDINVQILNELKAVRSELSSLKTENAALKTDLQELKSYHSGEKK